MSTDLVSVPPTATIAEAATVMGTHRVGSALVMDEHALLGIFTERDILRSLAGDFDAPGHLVSQSMTRSPRTVDAGHGGGRGARCDARPRVPSLPRDGRGPGGGGRLDAGPDPRHALEARLPVAALHDVGRFAEGRVDLPEDLPTCVGCSPAAAPFTADAVTSTALSNTCQSESRDIVPQILPRSVGGQASRRRCLRGDPAGCSDRMSTSGTPVRR